jgi:thiol:disulfide interchange protein DsbC
MRRFGFTFGRLSVLVCVGLLLTDVGFAHEAAIRKNIAERVPNFPAIDEITKFSIPGLFELRAGTDVFYTDENGDHLFRGHIIDTKTRTNLTEERIAKLNVINFSTLPLKDALMWKKGSGTRKIVVFADPNCGYCKKFERELQQIKDITVYTFLYPILGPDSHKKSRNIWCAKDSSKVWSDWMLRDKNPAVIGDKCDASLLQRNLALGEKYRIDGTPGIVFEDGKLVAGAMEREQIEKQLSVSEVKN